MVVVATATVSFDDILAASAQLYQWRNNAGESLRDLPSHDLLDYHATDQQLATLIGIMPPLIDQHILVHISLIYFDLKYI